MKRNKSKPYRKSQISCKSSRRFVCVCDFNI